MDSKIGRAYPPEQMDLHEGQTPVGKSQRLRVSDVSRAYQLIGECCDLWAEPSAWRRRLLEGTVDLTSSMVGMMQTFWLTDQPVAPVLQEVASAGWPDEATYRNYKRISEDNPPMVGIDHALGVMMKEGEVTIARHHHIPDDVWEKCTYFQSYMRPADSDHFIVNMRPGTSGPNAVDCYAVGRQLNDPRYSERDVKLIRLLRHEISSLIGTRLTTEAHHSIHGLQRRCRATLELLMRGASEKEVARELHRSVNTIHEHIMIIYRHFNVSSRAELLAYFIQRTPRPIDPNGQLPNGALPDGNAGR